MCKTLTEKGSKHTFIRCLAPRAPFLGPPPPPPVQCLLSLAGSSPCKRSALCKPTRSFDSTSPDTMWIGLEKQCKVSHRGTHSCPQLLGTIVVLLPVAIKMHPSAPLTAAPRHQRPPCHLTSTPGRDYGACLHPWGLWCLWRGGLAGTQWCL